MEDWGEIVGCPHCQGALQIAGDELACTGCHRRFPVQDRIPALLRQEDAQRLAGFSQRYREARLRDGWQPLSEDQALALPFGRPPGYPALYWEVRRQSYRVLMRLLAREGPSPAAGPAADLGAGNGWLSYRLAQAGYRVVALEASRDEAFGLGAAQAYFSSHVGFLPIQGDLEHPPLRPGAVSLLVFNASLHYAHHLAETLCLAARALQPEGRLLILDSPIAPQPHPSTGLGDRHLGRYELDTALASAGLHPRWIAVRRGPRWWLHRARAGLKRDAPFSFPLVVAQLRT
jgi:SAM-dependent methyltransferase